MFGMSEMFGPMAGECKNKNGLHYLNQYLMIEIVDPKTGEPVDEGKPGVAVYTTLWSKGFPLLRYWTDDVMVLTTEKCSCGSPYPRLFYKGRLADCFEINGHYVFPESIENILFKYGYIGDYCVEDQDKRFLIKTEGANAEINPMMLDECRALLCADVEAEVVTMGSLHYDGHGKRFIHKD